ncbi:hypothetical protein C5B95_11035 [Rathayibacter sp. AY1A7]|nr:hypothetical protein C5B95_11035 [Rathayibacter sp. AY1A7]
MQGLRDADRTRVVDRAVDRPERILRAVVRVQAEVGEPPLPIGPRAGEGVLLRRERRDDPLDLRDGIDDSVFHGSSSAPRCAHDGSRAVPRRIGGGLPTLASDCVGERAGGARGGSA